MCFFINTLNIKIYIYHDLKVAMSKDLCDDPNVIKK